jgi:rod shape-determining protein MreB
LVRDAKTRRTLSEPPIIAMVGGLKVNGTNPEVLAIGADAVPMKDQPNITIANPFAHPRSPLSDFTAAELILKTFVHKLLGGRILGRAPVMVLHLAAHLEGGITQIEARALIELGIGAGASRCFGWLGQDLSDEQLVALQFPGSGQVIDASA